MKTRVYITVDVECAEERGKSPAQGYDLRVWGRFSNQARELGVGFIMEALEARQQRATFFLEPLGAHAFGRDGLAEVAQQMMKRGHDVQLHLHPVQRDARYKSHGRSPAPDDMADYDRETQTALLVEGTRMLAEAGVPRERLVAFRAGNFGANNDTWGAMRDAGLVLSSNYNPGYFDKRCQMRRADASPGLFQVEPGLWELPISNMVEASGRLRHVQITALSSEEMMAYLLEARRIGLGEVTLVTHSFEFCHIDSIEKATGRPNRVNVRRLEALTRFLHERRDLFEVDTVGALGERLQRGSQALVACDQMPRGRRWLRFRRQGEQLLKRLDARIRI